MSRSTLALIGIKSRSCKMEISLVYWRHFPSASIAFTALGLSLRAALSPVSGSIHLISRHSSVAARDYFSRVYHLPSSAQIHARRVKSCTLPASSASSFSTRCRLLVFWRK
nr:hypothetical protein CFP56_42207 [Quercus suber]